MIPTFSPLPPFPPHTHTWQKGLFVIVRFENYDEEGGENEEGKAFKSLFSNL